MNFTFKKELDIGNIITSLSILLSVFALWLSWHNDSTLKTKEYADRIRRSTSIVTAKIERWSELSERYFEDIQPAIIDASEQASLNHQTEPANRILVKGLKEAEAKSSQRVVDEQLQLSYMELYGYVPALQTLFDSTIDQIKGAEKDSHEQVSLSLQNILRDRKTLNLTNSPEIGNPMRGKADTARKDLRLKIRSITEPLREKMLALIQMSDDDLANSIKRNEITKRIAEGNSGQK
jgi:hypothetical protein